MGGRVSLDAAAPISRLWAPSVLDGRCSVGVIGTLQSAPPDLSKEWLFNLPLVTVVGASHPLADLRCPIATSVVERHVQVVLTDRSTLTAGQSSACSAVSHGASPNSQPNTPSCAQGLAGAICPIRPSPTVSPLTGSSSSSWRERQPT
jgi:DNA-binding transcriptional LysR family regulator